MDLALKKKIKIISQKAKSFLTIQNKILQTYLTYQLSNNCIVSKRSGPMSDKTLGELFAMDVRTKFSLEVASRLKIQNKDA